MKFDALKRDSAQSKAFIMSETEYVAENMSVRGAGSVAEADAADHFAEKLESLGAKVTKEEFDVAPAAAFGWIGVTAVCVLLAYVAYFFVSMVSVALIIVALVPLVVQGVLMSRAHTFRPAVKGRMKWVLAIVVASLVGTLYLLAADIARWAYLGSVGTGLVTEGWLIAGLVGIVFVPAWIAALFLIDGKKLSVGAGDDLTGCCVALAVMKALAESGVKPAHTEVGVILTGAEECGLRGSKASCDAHAEEYRGSETSFVTLDTLRDARLLKVHTRDLNGLKALDKDAVGLVKAAADNAGTECGEGGIFLGATDAASFASAGLKATGVTAFDPMSETYHTENDLPESLDADFLEKCYLLALGIVEELDGRD